MPLLVPRLPKGPYYGILAEFATPADLYHACERVRDAGFTRWDAHTPFPVHGLEGAMGLRRSPLPWIVLVMGLTGAALGFVLQWWVHASAYPLVISGKPFFSWPAFIPITFEVGSPLRRARRRLRHARPEPAPHAPPSALPIQGLRAGDRRRLLHLDRIVGSPVRSVGHREAAGVPGRTKRRAPGVLNDPRTRSRRAAARAGHDPAGAPVEPHSGHWRRLRPAGGGGLRDSGGGESEAVLLLVARVVPVLSEPGPRRALLRADPVRGPGRMGDRAATDRGDDLRNASRDGGPLPAGAPRPARSLLVGRTPAQPSTMRCFAGRRHTSTCRSS